MNGFSIDIPDGTSRQSAYRIALRALDDSYTNRPVPDVHVAGEEVDENIDDNSEPSERDVSDIGEVDGGQQSETTDSGESDAPPELGGEGADEGAPRVPDHAPEPTSDADVEPIAAERTEQTSRPSEGQHVSSPYYFAAGEATRGTN